MTLLANHFANQQKLMPFEAVKAQLFASPKAVNEAKTNLAAARGALLAEQAKLRKAKHPEDEIKRSLAPLLRTHTRALRGYSQKAVKLQPAKKQRSKEQLIRRIKTLHRGVILWQGESLLTGEPIAIMLQHGSGNSKTGAMHQTYILMADIPPLSAMQNRIESAICGTCPHRPQKDGTRSCYVDLRSIQGAWQSVTGTGIRTGIAAERRYLTLQEVSLLLEVSEQEALAMLGSESKIRLGTYGDPAAVPAEILSALVSKAESWTGYTHQWENPAVPAEQKEALKPLVMASVDSAAQYVSATTAGWIPFVVTSSVEAGRGLRFLADLPVAMCPASQEAGQRVTCSGCPIGCNGTSQTKPKAVFIKAHGNVTTIRSYAKHAAQAWA